MQKKQINIQTKYCSKCGESKPISEFNKNKSKKDELDSWCRKCANRYSRQWKKDHPEYKKQWKKDNPEYDKQYYQDHKEEIIKHTKQYRQEHKKECSERNKQWNQNNPEYMSEYMKQWRKNNREKCNQYHQRRMAKVRNLPCDLSHTEWAFTKILFEDKCAYCEEPIEGAIHHEHIIIPENGGGFVFGNIVPACGTCNHSKFQKDVYVWMEEKDYNIQKFKDRLQIIESVKSERNLLCH